MDLAIGISNLQAAKTMSQAQFAVARKVLDMQQLQGSAAIKLIEAATKGASQASDALTAAATGLGANIDAYG
ncbi:MAG: putative motility protein [Phycisphaerales bacterium]|jgi:hypothetical protein|nr:putative motility protein [Phycisphaerales bacterium]